MIYGLSRHLPALRRDHNLGLGLKRGVVADRRTVRRGDIDAIQSPVPGSEEKYFSNLPSMPSKSLASAGASFFWVILGQLLAYSVFTSSHFSRPGSVSGLMASAGHSGSHTPQSMHSSG